MSTRTYLLTGGAGFIGTALSSRLVCEDARVVVVDNLLEQVHGKDGDASHLDPRVEFVCGDVTQQAVWDDVLSRYTPDVVVHLAAETGTGQSLTEATRHAHTNVCGTATMLDALARHGILDIRIVLPSSRAVYGEGAWRDRAGAVFYPPQRSPEQLAQKRWDFDGATPLAMRASGTRPAPVSVYGATKLAQEHMLSTWAKSFGVRHVIVRLQNVYGPGQSLRNPYTGIVSLFCRLARAQQSIPVYEDGAIWRDFVLVDDVADALLRAASASDADRGIFDIGSGHPVTVRELADEIAAIYEAPPPRVTGEYRLGDVRHAFADIAPAASCLGWSPRYSLPEGLLRLSSWIDDTLAREEAI